MVAYIVNMFIIRDDRPRIQAIRGRRTGAGGGNLQRYIRQPGYIAGLIYGPRGPRYNGFPLYNEAKMAKLVFDIKYSGKGENAGYQHFLLFPRCFL